MMRTLSARLLCTTVVGRSCWAIGGGPGGTVIEIGVAKGLMKGNATGRINGSKSNNPTTNTCSPNEVSVIQLRRERWAYEVSSMLSANMVSSLVKSCCCYGHQRN